MATDSRGSARLGFGVPTSVVEDLLSEPRRQMLLACLDGGGSQSVDDLARAIVARERGVDTADVSESQWRAVREELYQTHLPKLTATGIVEYDSMRGSVELATPAICDYLDQ